MTQTYTDEQVLSDETPIFQIDLQGDDIWKAFNGLSHMLSVTKTVGDLYTGKRTKPYRMPFYAYRFLSQCSNHNRKLLMELRTRGLIVGCDDA